MLCEMIGEKGMRGECENEVAAERLKDWIELDEARHWIVAIFE